MVGTGTSTSFLCAFYLKQLHSHAAAAHAATMKEPLHLTALLTYEFRQSLRFQVWRRAANPRESVALPEGESLSLSSAAEVRRTDYATRQWRRRMLSFNP